MKDFEFPTNPVLIVDDDENALQSFELTLNSAGINNIRLCQDSCDVMSLLKSQKFDLILLDLTMPNITGEQLLSQIMQDYADIPVTIITGNSEIDTAVKCMQVGAFDYMVKPVEENRLVSGVKRSLELSALRRENQKMKTQFLYGELNQPEAFSSIVTRKSSMMSIFKYIEVIAPSPEPVLITGETGVGKELIARAVHDVSTRKGAFVSVNVAGLDDNIFSDTLFGHKKGAFTDASTSRSGLIEQAAGGTLFLDEIGDLSYASQIRLLRLLQEHEYYPLGSDVPKYTDAHIIAATNQNIDDFKESGNFRKDLYFRLCVHHIHIPSLRERKDDIPLLVDHFMEEAAHSLNKKKPSFSKELYNILMNYNFPGNIRELRSLIYDAVTSHESGMLSLKSFRGIINNKNRPHPEERGNPASDENSYFLFPSQNLPTMQEAEIILIQEALKRSNGNQSIAAQLLGITRQTLNRKLKKDM